ncbi:hypothetical protein RIF29_15306 [Crotalaria pallida]|uniref:Myb/SANT-like domain-containing protein n=1 Tax=Crotalaria pallida TaxID=3830 RepID=A0AAN9IEI5_CROPI
MISGCCVNFVVIVASRQELYKDLILLKFVSLHIQSSGSQMSNNEVLKEKTCWYPKATECFITTCLEQVSQGERLGSSFTKKGWKGIVFKFNDLTGRKYDKAKLKNRYDNLRKDWRVWYNLFGKETGLGGDSVRNTVAAPDEWWESKQLEIPQYGKFRNKGLPFARELTELFKGAVATGEFAWAPSCGILPNGHGSNDNDGYRPCLDSMLEASGDSEDASVGATNEFADININASQGTVSHGVGSQKSGDKRKRISPAEKKKKKKTTASSKIAEAVSVIAETCRSRNDVVTSASIGEVMAELQYLDEVSNDLDLHTKCCQLMMFKPTREMFVALRGFEEKRLHWLRQAANNPFPFM